MKELWRKLIRWLAKKEIEDEVRKRKAVIYQRDKLKAMLRNKEKTHAH